jgi:hypothetical protein
MLTPLGLWSLAGPVHSVSSHPPDPGRRAADAADARPGLDPAGADSVNHVDNLVPVPPHRGEARLGIGQGSPPRARHHGRAVAIRLSDTQVLHLDAQLSEGNA